MVNRGSPMRGGLGSWVAGSRWSQGGRGARVRVFWALGLFEWRRGTERVGVRGLRPSEEQIAPPLSFPFI